tara:strand:+ start:106 stop:567 length:462 start_codon:yes stop_codon:yes gene_type:complete
MMKKLSKVVLAFLMLGFVSINGLGAQDLTDEDFKDYAIILLAQKSITDKISPYVNELIEKQDGIDGNRYAELDAAAGGDVAKLPADATDFEKQFYGIVQKQVNKKKKAAQTVVSQLATHGIGAKKYNAVKKAYAGGGDAKAKVDGYLAELSAE